jgi:hypothetical protein
MYAYEYAYAYVYVSACVRAVRQMYGACGIDRLLITKSIGPVVYSWYHVYTYYSMLACMCVCERVCTRSRMNK